MEFIATGPDETRGELGPPAPKTQRTEGGAELPPILPQASETASRCFLMFSLFLLNKSALSSLHKSKNKWKLCLSTATSFKSERPGADYKQQGINHKCLIDRY